MKYNVAIVEDNESYSELIQTYLKKYAKERHVDFNIYVYTDGDEITSDYQAKYDIILLDIEMKRLDGYTSAQKIRSFDKNVVIIFITNMAQYAIKGYSVDALSFVLKPLTYFALSEEIKKSIDKIAAKKEKFILLPEENGIIKQNIHEIIYIESLKHDIIIVTEQGTYKIRSTMKKLEEQFKDSNFFRSNNSYLVNLSYVKGVNDEFIQIDKYELKLARPRKKQFMEALTNYIGTNK